MQLADHTSWFLWATARNDKIGMKRISLKWPSLRIMALSAVMFLLLGCAMNGRQSLMIDARHVPAIQYMPGEITTMLEDLGYKLIPNTDPVKAAERYGEYRLQFKARDAENIRIDVHIRMVDNVTGIHLYDTADKTPGAATAQRYNELKKRVELEFGAENVSNNHPFLTP